MGGPGILQFSRFGAKCKHTPYLQPLVYILSSGDCARNVEQSLFFQQ